MAKIYNKRLIMAITIVLAIAVFLLPYENIAATKKPSKISLNVAIKTMYVGDSFQLKVKSVSPTTASKAVIWKSSNKKIATVSAKGKVVAKKAGTVKITAQSKKNKSVKKVAKITIKNKYYTVLFKTCFDELIEGQAVQRGTKAKIPQPPEIEGFEFYGWVPVPSKVYSNTTCYALYRVATKSAKVSYHVVFTDYNGDILKEETVTEGKNATPPENPSRKGYTFAGWDKAYDYVASDLIIKAKYVSKSIAPCFEGSNVTAKVGKENVRYAVNINNNPGILGMTLKVQYDEQALILQSATSGNAVSDILAFTPSKVLSSGCQFVYDGQDFNNDQIKDGEVLVLIFDVKNSAKSGAYPITISYADGDIIDRALLPVSIDISNGFLTVEQ